MPRSPAQSDFVIASEPVDIALPDAARAVELPRMVVRTNEAGEFATRWVMRFTFLVLAILAILCIVGPHIPAGE
ncbi:MAG TPA: hypothetical protein VGO00_25380 [Kofleriaceae bacterium]|jgi:hypothetical protein|nr:hypothetical protein [Kofleriaceae bacterium]